MLTTNKTIIAIAGLILFSAKVEAQDTNRSKPVQYVVKPAYLNNMTPASGARYAGSKNYLMDSLSNEILFQKSQIDSLLLLLNNELSRSQALDNKVAKLSETNENLNNELELTRGDQLKTSHTSTILLIFNILAGIILLVALVWIFNRKKDDPAIAMESEIKTTSRLPVDQLDKKMDRIEKLGKLRDKGLLTDEEFHLQKKQILG